MQKIKRTVLFCSFKRKSIMSTDDNDKEFSFEFSLKQKWYLGIGIVVIVISPLIFSFPAKFNWLDFSETGQIGDTIGGVTAPLINLFAAYLIFISFKEQYRANRQQWKGLIEKEN